MLTSISNHTSTLCQYKLQGWWCWESDPFDADAVSSAINVSFSKYEHARFGSLDFFLIVHWLVHHISAAIYLFNVLLLTPLLRSCWSCEGNNCALEPLGCWPGSKDLEVFCGRGLKGACCGVFCAVLCCIFWRRGGHMGYIWGRGGSQCICALGQNMNRVLLGDDEELATLKKPRPIDKLGRTPCLIALGPLADYIFVSNFVFYQ